MAVIAACESLTCSQQRLANHEVRIRLPAAIGVMSAQILSSYTPTGKPKFIRVDIQPYSRRPSGACAQADHRILPPPTS